MYRSEKRSLYRFLTIYFLSTFILFSLGFYIFYVYEKHHILDIQEKELSREGSQIQHQLIALHEQFDDRLALHINKPYRCAFFSTDKQLIFSNIENIPKVDFDREYRLRANRLIHIKTIEPYYLGVHYIVIETALDESRIDDLQKMILLFMLGTGVFFLVLGYYLGRLFIAPMRESIEMMNNFIQDTTHELNTPISTILANLELIETLHDCTAKKEMQRIEIASKTLSRIYDDLTYLKLNHDYNREIEALNISTLLAERLVYFSSAIDAKKITLHENIEQNIIIEIDRNDMIRLFDNLLSNAIKYNLVGGELTLWLDEKKLIVRDSGIGIESSDLKSIFERFKRVNKSEGGFGIGLDIVYQIVKAYHFEIAISSEFKQGTEVTIQW